METNQYRGMQANHGPIHPLEKKWKAERDRADLLEIENDTLKRQLADLTKPKEWIPVTERLPEEGELVQLTVEVIEGVRDLDIGFLHEGKWLRRDVSDLNEKVLAWAPPLQPYQGE